MCGLELIKACPRLWSCSVLCRSRLQAFYSVDITFLLLIAESPPVTCKQLGFNEKTENIKWRQTILCAVKGVCMVQSRDLDRHCLIAQPEHLCELEIGSE